MPSPIVTVGGVSISPDGTEVAFAGGTAESEGTFDIYGMKLRAGDPEWRRVVSDGILPFWSPDGRHLAFTSFRDGNLDLYVVDRDGGKVRSAFFAKIWYNKMERYLTLRVSALS